MPAIVYYTADMVRALPEDGNRHETVHGELLVSPSPRLTHQVVLQRLTWLLSRYLHDEGFEGLFSVDADISWGPDLLVQPDLFVADPEEMRRAGDWADVRTLYLVAEVLSPSSLRADRFTKRRLYQEQRIPAYWIVDVENQQFETWTPEAPFPVIERERLAWRHPRATSEGVIQLSELFRPR